MKDDDFTAVLDYPPPPEAVSDYELERNKPMPTTIHGSVQANLIIAFSKLIGERFRIASEVTLYTQPTASTPDVLLLPPSALDFSNDPAKRTSPVLLTVEIISPSQSLDIFLEKAISYFQFGVKSCWIVLPRIKAVMVFNRPDEPDFYRFFKGTDEIEDETLGIRLPVEKVFA